jgi:hypothetical protein
MDPFSHKNTTIKSILLLGHILCHYYFKLNVIIIIIYILLIISIFYLFLKF